MPGHDPASSPSLSQLPQDELIYYGRTLGLALEDDAARGEALRRIRARQELLIELDRQAMLDVVIWMRQPVRRSASKQELAAVISNLSCVRFDGLSTRGLQTLARLWDVPPSGSESRSQLEKRLRRTQGLTARFRRARRRAIGSLVSKLVSTAASEKDAYRFLPEDSKTTSLKDEIEQTGLMGGVARKLKGVADDYVHEKLDEIERRIDGKLDEIDTRLGEWRDREIGHRLRLLKLTLIFSILVAVLSLLYDFFRQ